MEGAILNLSELRSINSTTWDPCDKAEHKIQKETKSFYSSDPLLHNKLFQTEGCKTIIILAYLTTLRISSSDWASEERLIFVPQCLGLSWEEWEGWGDSDILALELSGGYFIHMSSSDDSKSALSQDGWTKYLHMASPWGLVFLQCGSWILRDSISRENTWRENIPREPNRSAWPFMT